MKRIILALFIACFTLSLTAQSERSLRQDDWLLSFGLNTVNTLGTKGPFNNPGDWAYRFPLAASLETKWFDIFSIEIGLSLNGIDANQRIDAAGPSDESLTYFAIDTSLKYYFGEYIFPDTEWIDFYGNAGIGLFMLDGANLSFNFGGGVMFWLNRSRRFGIRAQGLGKFAFDHSDTARVYANNHFQYSLQAVFKI